VAVLASAAAALTLGACGSGKTPPGHEGRLLKAAGVTWFQVTCTKDIWEATKPYDELDHVTVVRRKGKVNTYELTGTELVAYLRELQRNAYDPWCGKNKHRHESERMYNAISPTVDALRATPGPDAQVPAVNLDDAVAPAPSPRAT
jgi:hypothetical protein